MTITGLTQRISLFLHLQSAKIIAKETLKLHKMRKKRTHSICVWELETQALTDIWQFGIVPPANQSRQLQPDPKFIQQKCCIHTYSYRLHKA